MVRFLQCVEWQHNVMGTVLGQTGVQLRPVGHCFQRPSNMERQGMRLGAKEHDFPRRWSLSPNDGGELRVIAMWLVLRQTIAHTNQPAGSDAGHYEYQQERDASGNRFQTAGRLLSPTIQHASDE